MPTNDEVIKYAQELIGTCQSLDDEFCELPLEQCYLMDEIVMCCDTCGWWIASEDMGDESTCLECEEY
jgi:hypothetical protein